MIIGLLDELNKIEGVDGAFITSNRAEIINKVGLSFTDDQLKNLSLNILRTVAAFHLTGKKTVELEFYWQNLYIICKNTDNFMLITFCRTTSVLALLRITINVTMAKLSEDKKFSKWLKSHKADQNFLLRKGSLEELEEKLIQPLI